MCTSLSISVGGGCDDVLGGLLAGGLRSSHCVP